MLVLSETNDQVQIVLNAPVTTNQLRCMSVWRDVTTTAYTPGRTLVNTNNASDVNLVPAPSASTQRVVDFLSVYNSDTATAQVTIKFDANGTEYTLWNGALATGEKVEYVEGVGFRVLAVNGLPKVQSTQAAYVANNMNIVVLPNDVINNNAVANTIADVTGLSFSVIAGQTYWFEFVIPYTAAAATTGSRWTINGPANPTMLSYRSEYPMTATTTTVNAASAYDIPAASNASSLTTGNVATIWGVITPSSNGTVTARFASEILSSAITAKAGATLRWVRVL